MNLLDLGEGDDFIEFSPNLLLGHAKDRAVQKDVLAARQLGMKAGAHFQQAGYSSPQANGSCGRFGDPAEDLQKRALAGPIAPDDSDDFAAFDLEADVFERPEFLDAISLQNLAAANEVAHLAFEIGGFKLDRVAQRGSRTLGRQMTQHVFL